MDSTIHRGSDWLLRLASRHLTLSESEQLKHAVAYAEEHHHDFVRLDQEPYINHVIAVAETLANWRAPLPVLVAGLFHDLFKPDYAMPPNVDEIAAEFGEDVVDLIHDVARLGRNGPMLAAGRGDSEEDAMAQLPWVAMILQKSPTAVVIKLADKLHNFRTIDVLPEARRHEFATTTMRIFVPFAERLGMRQVKRKLQDMAFYELHSETYQGVYGRYPKKNLDAWADQIIAQLETRLVGNGMSITTKLQPRTVYDLFRIETAQTKKPLPFARTQTIIVETESAEACYQALGHIHQLFPPQVNQFQDFIATPKANGYRGLHTRLRLPDGEIQLVAIRTREMNLVADHGLTAQWHGVDKTMVPQFKTWRPPPEGMVTVVTPEGELIQLPEESTPIDFAYTVHWALGNQCTGALVNGRNVALDHSLQTGDVVQILSGNTNIGPSPEWLDFVKTKRAKRSIRRWLVRENPANAADTGWQLIKQQLQAHNQQLTEEQADAPLTAVAHRLGYDTKQNLLIAVGIKQRDIEEVTDHLLRHLDPISRQPALKATVASLTGDEMPQRLGKCCNPIPPDPIVGYVTKEGTVTIHRTNCPRVRFFKALVNADWNMVNMQLQSLFELQCIDRPGLVADVSRVMSDSGTNMTSFHAGRIQDGTAYIRIGVGDLARVEQTELQAKLKAVPNVERVHVRITKGESSDVVQQPAVTNPYTLRPVRGTAFYGRRAELMQLLENLRSTGPGEAVLLWGPRRIGKTSLLLEFQQSIMNSDDYILGFVDMQRLSGRSTTVFLRDILKSIITELKLPKVQPPKINRMRRDPLGYFRGFIESNPAVQKKHIVLIIDEFQLLNKLTEPEIPLADITVYFRSLIQHRGGVSIIFSGGGVLDQLLAQPETSFMLEVVRHQKIECLRPAEARQLIVQPANQMMFQDEVVTALLKLTAGHPYYLQWLCGELVSFVTRDERTSIEKSDLATLLLDWLPQQGEQFFNHLWGSAMGFTQTEQGVQLLLLTAVSAHTQHAPTVSEADIVTTLAPHIHPDQIQRAISNLHKIDTLQKKQSGYQIRIPLCQQWLLANHSLEQLLRNHTNGATNDRSNQ